MILTVNSNLQLQKPTVFACYFQSLPMFMPPTLCVSGHYQMSFFQFWIWLSIFPLVSISIQYNYSNLISMLFCLITMDQWSIQSSGHLQENLFYSLIFPQRKVMYQVLLINELRFLWSLKYYLHISAISYFNTKPLQTKHTLFCIAISLFLSLLFSPISCHFYFFSAFLSFFFLISLILSHSLLFFCSSPPVISLFLFFLSLLIIFSHLLPYLALSSIASLSCSFPFLSTSILTATANCFCNSNIFDCSPLLALTTSLLLLPYF